MSKGDEIGPDEGGDALLAAEFVLGALSGEERAAAQRRIDQDAAFARLVEQWEAHFEPLGAGYPDVAPPAAVKAALDRRLFVAAPRRIEVRPPLWNSLAFWRGLAGIAIAALLIALLLPFVLDLGNQSPQTRLVASLAAEGSDVRYIAVYDPSLGSVDLSHVSGAREGGHDFELWMVEGTNPPVSMGVIPVGSAVHLPVPAQAREHLDAGAKLAISLEPAGGSPTGLPTGPVVSVGDLFRL